MADHRPEGPVPLHTLLDGLCGMQVEGLLAQATVVWDAIRCESPTSLDLHDHFFQHTRRIGGCNSYTSLTQTLPSNTASVGTVDIELC